MYKPIKGKYKIGQNLNSESRKILAQKILERNSSTAKETLKIMGFEITPVDKVVSRSELPVEEVLTRLTMLELRGLVSAVPGGYIRTQ